MRQPSRTMTVAENRYAAASASQQNVVEFRGKNDHARPAFNAWRWLNQVASDETLTHANLRVAHALANFFNISKSGLCWPKQENLARCTRLTRRCVIAAIDAIEASGHLLREREAGSRGKLSYRAIEFDARDDDGSASVRPQCEPAFTSEGERAFTSDVNGRSHSEPPFTPEGERPFTQENIEFKKNIYTREDEKRAAPKTRERDAEFAVWWAAFPKRVAKEDAREAYDLARASIDCATLLAGAARYARERDGKDHQFTKHPATWLRKGCWADHERPQARVNDAERQSEAPAAPDVWVASDSPEGRAWVRVWRDTKGKSPPQDAKGGWRFPSRWPSGHGGDGAGSGEG